MNRTTALLVLCSIAVAASVFAAQPDVAFGPDGVSILEVKPGTKVAWMSLTRAPLGSHATLRIDRGIEMATPSRKAEVARVAADRSRALWVIAAIDEDLAGSAVSPRYEASSLPIAITAVPGATEVTVISPEIEVMYVRPKGGAWFLSATDGGRNDLDLQQNATIAIPLSAMERVAGNPHPPNQVAAGDLLLMIDPRANRVAVFRVTQ